MEIPVAFEIQLALELVPFVRGSPLAFGQLLRLSGITSSQVVASVGPLGISRTATR